MDSSGCPHGVIQRSDKSLTTVPATLRSHTQHEHEEALCKDTSAGHVSGNTLYSLTGLVWSVRYGLELVSICSPWTIMYFAPCHPLLCKTLSLPFLTEQ